jgi:hypothetical protein
VFPDGTINTVGVAPGAYNVQSVVGDANGNLYAATNDPDYLIMIAAQTPVCEQLALQPGNLIQATGQPEVDIVAPGCLRRRRVGMAPPSSAGPIRRCSSSTTVS